ncbi:MAG: transporter substrate-binding domain-containing protein, partial [Lachnospiraceae bacterium]|nr:transporter substrate-binding domain-containing protein [Lachnospiraceae bacterium]
ARGCSIAVAKGNEELLDDVDKALDAIIADGTVFRITNKYITAE